MIAQKHKEKIQITPYEAEHYMTENWVLLDDNEYLLEDPLGYAKEQIKILEEPKTIEISIPDIRTIKQIQADVAYIAMCSDVEL